MKLEYEIENETLVITLNMGYMNETYIKIPLKDLKIEEKPKSTRSKAK